MRLSSAMALVVALLTIAASSVDAKPLRGSPQRLRATATAYCQRGETKDGTPVHNGVLAADPRVLPLGSVVRLEVPDVGLSGIYTVNDTGSAVKGRIIDIFMWSCARAKRFGRRSAIVHVLMRGAPLALAMR
jgi:3D (Asp-Asp-Asp) domain-containing protein